MSTTLRKKLQYAAHRYRRTIKQSKAFKWIVDIAVLLTLLPPAYPHPAHPWIPALERILYSGAFLYSILAAYAVVDISYGLMKMLGKRTNPSLILTGSFIVLIPAESFILMMPRCATGELSYVDSLFVATSAVCITGLIPRRYFHDVLAPGKSTNILGLDSTQLQPVEISKPSAECVQEGDVLTCVGSMKAYKSLGEHIGPS